MRNVSLVLIIAAMSCKSNEREAPPLRSEAAEPNMSGAMPRKMANCPASVPGATTKLGMTTDGIDVTITAHDPAVAENIRTLAEYHAHMDTTGLGLSHTGLRGGASRIGFCPIIHDGTTVTTAVVPEGVRVHVRASSPQRVNELQAKTTARAARLPGFVAS